MVWLGRWLSGPATRCLVFVFELGVLGGMDLYASRTPEKSGLLVLRIIWAEVFGGAVADALWIARGYSASSYLPFILVHLIIIPGVLFMRQETAKTAPLEGLSFPG